MQETTNICKFQEVKTLVSPESNGLTLSKYVVVLLHLTMVIYLIQYLKRYFKGYIMPVTKKLFSLDSVVADELEMLASALKMTQKEVVERALDFYFDHTDSIIAQKISHDVEEGTEQTYDAKEIFDELGLIDV